MKFCANIIANFIPRLNVIELSRMLDLPKLEMTAIEFIAAHLEQICVYYSFTNSALISHITTTFAVHR